MGPRARGLELGRGHISAGITPRAEHGSPSLMNEPGSRCCSPVGESGMAAQSAFRLPDGGDSGARAHPSQAQPPGCARARASPRTREPGSERESRRRMAARKLATVAAGCLPGPITLLPSAVLVLLAEVLLASVQGAWTHLSSERRQLRPPGLRSTRSESTWTGGGPPWGERRMPPVPP